MRDHNPIFVSRNIFSLWSNYILYCFIIAENLQGHDPAHRISLHQILAYLIEPFPAIFFPIFCLVESIVKEVPFLYIQMKWNLYSSFICPNYHPPPNYSSIKSSMWAQVQFLFYGQIGTLQSKCYLDPSYYPQTFWALFHTQIIATW